MTILTHNLYPFVKMALKDAGHQVIYTESSQKLEKMWAKHRPDAAIIFGWDKNCQKFIETHDPAFLRRKHLHFLNRITATQALDDVALTKYPKRYYIAPASNQQARIADFGALSEHEDNVVDWVMKWGDAHRKRDKRLVTRPKDNLRISMIPREEVIIEPFVQGRSIRVLIIQGRVWKIEHINRKTWIKNVNPDQEIINPEGVPQEMINQAMAVSTKYSLGLVGVDFQLGKGGQIFPLKIDVMPGVPEDDGIRKAYAQYFLDLVK